MPVMVQVRNVPDKIHRKLKSRAALAGMSISEYLLREIIERALERPTPEEFLARLREGGSREGLSHRRTVPQSLADGGELFPDPGEVFPDRGEVSADRSEV